MLYPFQVVLNRYTIVINNLFVQQVLYTAVWCCGKCKAFYSIMEMDDLCNNYDVC